MALCLRSLPHASDHVNIMCCRYTSLRPNLCSQHRAPSTALTISDMPTESAAAGQPLHIAGEQHGCSFCGTAPKACEPEPQQVEQLGPGECFGFFARDIALRPRHRGGLPVAHCSRGNRARCRRCGVAGRAYCACADVQRRRERQAWQRGALITSTDPISTALFTIGLIGSLGTRDCHTMSLCLHLRRR